jgi:hypothetical protein
MSLSKGRKMLYFKLGMGTIVTLEGEYLCDVEIGGDVSFCCFIRKVLNWLTRGHTTTHTKFLF